ncbi:MAG: hypothetical protein WC792_03875 [Candidatus Micrarchaeia archaeon]|jgi:hypothetical protein
MTAETSFVFLVLGLGGVAFARVAYAYFENTSLAKPLAIMGVAYLTYLLGSFLEVLQDLGLISIDFEGAGPLFETAFVLLMIYGAYSFKSAFETFNWAEAKKQL